MQIYKIKERRYQNIGNHDHSSDTCHLIMTCYVFGIYVKVSIKHWSCWECENSLAKAWMSLSQNQSVTYGIYIFFYLSTLCPISVKHMWCNDRSTQSKDTVYTNEGMVPSWQNLILTAWCYGCIRDPMSKIKAFIVNTLQMLRWGHQRGDNGHIIEANYHIYWTHLIKKNSFVKILICIVTCTNIKNHDRQDEH